MQQQTHHGIPKSIHTVAPSGSSTFQQSSKARSFYGLKREWDGSVSSLSPHMETWQVQLEDLEQIPAFFPLEKTHREVSEDPSIIASRIADALQALSIQTEYCNKTVKAKCQTIDSVSFRIRMYAGSDSGLPVVVEIQRRSGSPSSFMLTCRVIMEAAAYGTIPVPQSPVARQPCASVSPLTTKLAPVKRLKCLEKVFKPIDDFEEVIQNLIHLLDGNAKADQQLLALENLLCMTDAINASPSTAVQASDSVFSRLQLRDNIFRQVETPVERQFQQDGDGMKALVGRKKQLAYAVLANALEFNTAPLEEDDWFSSRLLPAILEALHHAQDAACVAYQASRCASLVASRSMTLRQVLQNHRSILERALEYGQSRHELLRNEVQVCLQLLGQ